MKHTILHRSRPAYLRAIRDLSNSRLNVPMKAIRELKAECFRVNQLQKKNKEAGAIEKAAVSHKLGLIEGRLNYWKEFHRKLHREQRKAYQGKK
jgi:hypothetical protein